MAVQTLQEKIAAIAAMRKGSTQAVQQVQAKEAAQVSTQNPTLGELIANKINEQKQEVDTSPSFLTNFGTGLEDIKGFDLNDFSIKYQELEMATKAQAPDLENYLVRMNDQLNQYPELLHKLTTDKIKMIVGGWLQRKAIKLEDYAKAPKVAKKDKKALPDFTMDFNL